MQFCSLKMLPACGSVLVPVLLSTYKNAFISGIKPSDGKDSDDNADVHHCCNQLEMRATHSAIPNLIVVLKGLHFFLCRQGLLWVGSSTQAESRCTTQPT